MRRRDQAKVTALYRRAAVKVYGITEVQAAQAIYTPYDDSGQWAPDSLVIINLEYGHISSYWDADFWYKVNKMSAMAGTGYVECINPAICAVYP